MTADLDFARSETGQAAGGPSSPHFAEVFSEHAAWVLGRLRRLGLTQADAEDVAQEVFLVVHRQLPGFEGRSSLKTWIHGICLRTASTFRRRAYRHRELLRGEVPECATADDPAQRVQYGEHSALLEAALAALPAEQRQVFVLHAIEQWSVREIADMLGCPRFTVYTRLRLARRRLRPSLAALALCDVPTRAFAAPTRVTEQLGRRVVALRRILAAAVETLGVRPASGAWPAVLIALAVLVYLAVPVARPAPRPASTRPAVRGATSERTMVESASSVTTAATPTVAATADTRLAPPRAHRVVRQAARPDPEAEIALLRRARVALITAPSTALSLVARHTADYPLGIFVQEREIVAIEAELRLRDRASALARARRFVARFPGSPHAPRVRAFLERAQFMPHDALDATSSARSAHTVVNRL